MSMRFSNYTKVIAVMLVVAVCGAIVPSTIYSSDCDQKKKDAEKASDDAFWACLTSGAVCALSGGWACFVAALYCTKKLKDAADAWAAYWDCEHATA